MCSLIMLASSQASAQQVLSQIIIVKSSDNNYFNQSVETLIKQVDRSTEFKVVMPQDLDAVVETGDEQQIYVALGQTAAEAVGRLDGGISAFNAYLTEEQSRNLNLENQVAVLLDQPLQRYLAFCSLMLAVDSVGIITEQAIVLDQGQSDLLRILDFSLNQYQIDPRNKLLPVLRRLLMLNDALLMLPSQSVYNRDTLKGVLLAGYRNRKPVISYSPAHVKSGALASIYSSPVDIGRHLATLINRQLQTPGQQTRGFEFARYYSIRTNPRIAAALGIELPSERELRSALDRLQR
ncbi:MAG: hypothetical protein GWP56_03785 [Gammaproteobacteria bacterium]|nr:hypothetical protein [Gammaproteobacteria bacterium]